MDEEVRLLLEMFSNVPEETLLSVWHSCDGNFSLAVDEALTISSLGGHHARDGDARHEAKEDRWEDRTAFASAPSVESTAKGAAGPQLPRDEPRTRDDRLDNNLVGNTAAESVVTTAVSTPQQQKQQEQKRLPWETKAGYVMGSGELGLLNELQLPRRGTIVKLAPDFLRIPPPLRALESLTTSSEGLHLKFSPVQPRRAPPPLGENDLDLIAFHVQRSKNSDKHVVDDGEHPPTGGDDADGCGGGVSNNGGGGGDDDDDDDDGVGVGGSVGVVVNDGTDGDSVDPAKRVRVDPSLAPLALPPTDVVTLTEPLVEEEIASVDEVRRKPLLETEEVEDHAQNSRPRKVLDAAQMPGSSSSQNSPLEQTSDSPPHNSFGSMRGIVAAGRKVDTTSSADRIAAFPPGTKFRVAVDKGVTGLGITVKEIQRRFFVYRLQISPDGSPGAAEEAGVKAGDELLGVEELDFEAERWDIDQLVSYMRELVGVIILYMRRGSGPLARAPPCDEEALMSHGVVRTTGSGEIEGASARDREGSTGRGAVSKTEASVKRLLEILEEEELLKPSEATDTIRLHRQISDRARQWDSGELWLSVAGLARRPSPEAVAAFASRWQPGEPAGWDESDSSEEEEGGSQLSSGTPRNKGENHKEEVVISPGKRDEVDEANDPADLDTIGTALLGQPLFTDTITAAAAARIVAAPSSSTSAGFGRGEGGHPADRGLDTHDWSPWPQLTALEQKAARRRDTVVPTKGLRKALSVRVLGHVDLLAATNDVQGHVNGGKLIGGKSNGTLLPQMVPYLVWVMDVESGAEWKVRRTHSEFAELWDVCTGMRPSLGRLDFPSWLPNVKETPGMIEARRPRLEAYLQRLCSLLYMGPLHPSSAHVAHLLQDFLGTTPRVETLARLQRSRPERELRQALQVRAWQVLRVPPLERVVAAFIKEIMDAPVAPSKKAMSAETILKKLTDVVERLQYVVTEGCFDEFREMVRSSAQSQATQREALSQRKRKTDGEDKDGVDATDASDDVPNLSPLTAERPQVVEDDEGQTGEEAQGPANAPELDAMTIEDEAMDLISGSVRRQVEAEVFVPVMGRLYKVLRTEGPTARLEKAVALGIEYGRGKPQSFHGIPLRSLSPSSWGSASRLLKAVGFFTLPSDKLDALVAVAHAIPALYRAEHPGDESRQLGADDFLPIFIYVLVNSGVERVASLSLVLETLCDPKKMIGEAGFCVATLSAALQHLEQKSSVGDSRRGEKSTSFLARRSK